MKQKLHTIWNSDFDLADYKDMFDELEAEGTPVAEDAKYEYVAGMLGDYFEDEKMNLGFHVENTIIAIADLGLWNGRQRGYKVLTNKVSDCLQMFVDDMNFYCDKYNFRAVGHHHDGTNYYMFRELRKEKYLNVVKKKLMDGTLSDKELSRYTKGLRKPIGNVFGW